jgi:hypothetical protein
MDEFKSWEEMSVVEQYACQFWDMYKDANGFRPRHIDTSSWTEADFEAEFVSLSKVIERESILREEAEEKATIDFEMRVQSLMTSGAKDYEMAIRWVHEAEGSNGDEEYLCFLVGLPYGYFRQQTPVDAREYAELAADLDAISYGVA